MEKVSSGERAQSVLIIEDDAVIRDVMRKTLERRDIEVGEAETGEDAIRMVKERDYDLAICDLQLPGISGIEAIKKIKKINKYLEIIICTGYPSLDSSAQAIDQNVFTYHTKPVSMPVLLRSVRSAIEHGRLQKENDRLLKKIRADKPQVLKEARQENNSLLRRVYAMPCFVGCSQAMQRVRRQITEVATSDFNILIRGENGTGKDVVSRMISQLSGREESGSFVKINCPSIPETLLESELFGHEAGAFTGAVRRKPGRFEMAGGGTVFLDEIGDLPLTLQSKLLQVIEHKEFTRLGGNETIRVNARVIAATNVPIEDHLAEGRFRPDLYYRLSEYLIVIPPLRERPEDIPLLIEHFLLRQKAEKGYELPKLSDETMDLMFKFSWPGNVRQLENVLKRFSLSLKEETILEQIQPLVRLESQENEKEQDLQSLEETEVKMIESVLERTNWNQSQAAQILGISYSTLRRRITHYAIEKR
ncbi:MAG: sigma-54-dependent transcriptional regulator [Candidatus Sumerlaeia bacterium]